MRPDEERRDIAIDRRTFLRGLPGYVIGELKRVWSGDGASGQEFGPEAGDHRRSGADRRVAVLDGSRCLAWAETDCQLCYLQCPLRGEAIVLDGGKPVMVVSRCDGCGVCAEACRTVNDLGAISMARM